MDLPEAGRGVRRWSPRLDGVMMSAVDEQEIKDKIEAFIRDQWLIFASVGWRAYMMNERKR